ncbi:MAG: methyltransferase domain-containing protein [Pseudomonadota bacterium]
MPSPNAPTLFDPERIKAHRTRAAKRYGDYDFLKARVSRELIERLEDTPRHFPAVLEIGCHDGTLTRHLAAHSKIDHVIATDPSPAMAHLAHAPPAISALPCSLENVPFAPARFDLATSALSLHWANDLPGTLVQVRQALKPDGLWLAAMFGAGTLTELRSVLSDAETELRGGVSPRLSPLPGLQDVAGLMQRTGFALPVVDTEPVTVRYDTMFKLLDDLRGMAEQAAFPAHLTSPLRRDVLMAAAQAYHERFSDPDGRIRATFEIIWLSGWAPSESQPKPLRPGSAKASLAAAVGGIEQSAGEKAGQGDDQA